MPHEMAIRLSNGPVDELVRLHTERTDWDEPDVRYLRRKLNGAAKNPQPHAAGEDTVVFEFGNVEVTVHAIEDHIQVVLRRCPRPIALAA